jgi:hypothetical protein
LDPEATSRPSGENTTPLIELEWPSSLPRDSPVVASHNRTVQSLDPEATSRPSGENTTALTQLE